MWVIHLFLQLIHYLRAQLSFRSSQINFIIVLISKTNYGIIGVCSTITAYKTTIRSTSYTLIVLSIVRDNVARSKE